MNKSSLKPWARNKGKNPLDHYGNVTKCTICESINHWADACPDGQYFSEECSEKDTTDHQVTLFQSNLVTDDCMKIFTAESMRSATLDFGASSTVSGKKWMDVYIDSLSPSDQSEITYTTINISQFF